MLKHLPEGIVPFEDCGYARTPVQPMTGEPILLDCQSDDTPWLEIEGRSQHLLPQQLPDRWRFSLAPAAYPGALRYRFGTATELSRWYTVEILRPVTIDAPLAYGEGWAQLTPSLYLCAQQEQHGVSLCLQAEQPADAPCSPLSFGTQGLWQLSLSEGRTLVCPQIYLGLRADGSVAFQRTHLRGAVQHVYGTGERFDAVDQRGRGSCGQVVEHFTQQGPWSYLPIPAFLTDGGFGVYRATGCNVALSFGEELTLSSPWLPDTTDHLLLGTPAQQLRQYIQLTGQPVLPPEWAFGLWMSANGWSNDEEVDEQLRQMKAHDYPASVMVLEAWSDESTFYRWNDTWADAAATVQKLRDAGLHLVLWQIPVLKALHDCPDQDAVARDRAEAIANGYLVQHQDGSPYVIPERWFAGSLLPDFTNPEACAWWFRQRDHLLDMGVEGFKTDGGEFLFGNDIVLHDGTPGEAAHNLYPMYYERAYHQWMQQRGIQGVLFSRAGYAGAQTTPIHWAGDQLSTWPELAAQLRAGLSAGLSGVLFWSFDIGGFAGELPDAELYLRATAMGCFCPIMQWHAEPRSGQFYATHDPAYCNDRSPWNLAEKLHDPQLMDIAAGFARMRKQLQPYLWQEAQHCAAAGRPLMAHLCLDFPQDAQALSCHDVYMLGRRLLIAPITEQGASGRDVYLPQGRWRHCFTGEVFQGGTSRAFPCPLDQALVFERLNETEGGSPA